MCVHTQKGEGVCGHFVKTRGWSDVWGFVDREKPVLGDYPLNVTQVIQNQRRDLVGSGLQEDLTGRWVEAR